MTYELTVKIDEPQVQPQVERLGAQLYGYLLANARSDDPRTAADICKALELKTDSVVQSLVHDLRGRNSALVASRCHRPVGYYVARSGDEIKETMDNLYSRAVSLLYAYAGLKRGIVDERQGKLLL